MATVNSSARGASAASRLPLEVTLRILAATAEQTKTTQDAREICLLCREVYRTCWPTLYRIVGLRNARQLKDFSEFVYPPAHVQCRAGLAVPPEVSDRQGDKAHTLATSANAARRLARLQDAVRFLYINNNKDGQGLRVLASEEKPEMWMISILLAARNLEIIHFEEYWSLTYPWEAQEEKPLVAYPLMLLSRFTAAVHAAFVNSPNAPWVRRVLQIATRDDGRGDASQLLGHQDPEVREDAPTTDIYDAIMALERAESLRRQPPRLLAQPREVTLSALAVTRAHLVVNGGINDVSSKTRELPANEAAFINLERMHLYFPKLSPYFCEALMSLPALTHLRLTRPFAENIIESVVTILERGYTSTNPYEVISRPSGAAAGLPPLHSVIIETGIYMDLGTIRALRDLETSEIGRGRLHVMTASDVASSRQRASAIEAIAATGGISSTGADFAEALTRSTPDYMRLDRTPAVENVIEADLGQAARRPANENSTSNIVNYVTSSEQRGFEDFVARAHGSMGVWAISDVHGVG